MMLLPNTGMYVAQLVERKKQQDEGNTCILIQDVG